MTLTDGGVALTDLQQPTYTVRHAVRITFRLGSTLTKSGAKDRPARITLVSEHQF